jgi:hypothetical protein
VYKFPRPYLEKTHHKKGLVECQGVGPHTTYRIGENICKLLIRKGLISRICNNLVSSFLSFFWWNCELSASPLEPCSHPINLIYNEQMIRIDISQKIYKMANKHVKKKFHLLIREMQIKTTMKSSHLS